MTTPTTDIVTGEEAKCVNCGQQIAAVIDSSSGCVDWGSFMPGIIDGPCDFGCEGSPDSDDDGCGGHDPGEGHTPLGFRILIDSRTYWTRIEQQKETNP